MFGIKRAARSRLSLIALLLSFMLAGCGGGETQTQPLPVLSAAPAGDAGVDLTWTSSGAAASIQLLRNGEAIATLDPAQSSYADTAAEGDTAYTYQIVTTDSAGREARSNALSVIARPRRDRTPPSAPRSLQIATASASSVTISWTASTDNVGVVKYRIFRDEVLVGEATTTTFTDTAVEAQSTYTYEVVALDAAGNVSDLSNTADANTPAAGDASPPSAPAALTANAVGATRVNLAWSASTDNVGVTKYRVFRNGSSTALAETTATNHADTSVNANAAYSYVVKAVDAAGNVSPASNTANVTTPAAADTTAPSTPANLVAAAAGSTQINLSWTASSDNVGIAKYQVFRDGAATPLAETSGTTYADATVAAGSAHAYRVLALDAAGNASALSSSVSATTPGAADTSAPTVPTNVAAVAASAGRINLSWIASSDNVGVIKYRVFRNGSATALAEPTGTTYADTSVTGGTTYSYQVRAVDAANNASALSSTATATTPAAADTAAPSVPASLSATAVDSTRVNLAWIASTDNVGVAKYRVYRNGSTTPLAEPVGTTYSDVAVAAGTAYSYQVRAVDAANNASALSNIASVTTPTAPPPTGSWKPLTPGTSWQWQIDGGTINQTVLDGVANAKKMYDIDMENTAAATIAQLKAKGIYVVCYVETGAWENYRSDAASYPAIVLGKNMNGFPDERWVDIRRIDILRPIIAARLDRAKAKGCDGIEPDLDDSYTENTGFPLTKQDQINFNTAMVAEAHVRGMSMGLKNGPGIAVEMSSVADWALNEQCNNYSECDGYVSFIKAGKAVFNVEYTNPDGMTTAKFCPADNAKNFDGLLKLSSETLAALPRTACRFE